MSIWKSIKEAFFGAPLREQFEQLLVEEEARKQHDVVVPVEVAPEPVKEEEVAKKTKPAAKPAAKPAKNAKPAAKPAGKKKK